MTTIRHLLEGKSHTWLVTGAAGFIGSHLCEQLLLHGQRVVGLDNFSAGKPGNLDDLQLGLTQAQRSAFSFIEGDIVDPDVCARVCREVDYVLHQAAMGSVPQSIEDPAGAHASNVTGFLNVLEAAKGAGMKRVVYASSCAVYGDTADLPITEAAAPRPLSPYAATKWMDEIYAKVLRETYGLETVGLRYFNIYGPRQDPKGAYAAVIPKWIQAMVQEQPIQIHGDGETTRDFCYVLDVVQANVRAALMTVEKSDQCIFNVATGNSVSLNELSAGIQAQVERVSGKAYARQADYVDFRSGDIRHSSASVDLIREVMGFEVTHDLESGLKATVVAWLGDSST